MTTIQHKKEDADWEFPPPFIRWPGRPVPFTRPVSVFWLVGFSYLILVPLWVILPTDIQESNAWVFYLVKTMSSLVPMIERVVGYGNPHPEKLQVLLAAAWLLCPIFMACAWNQSISYLYFETSKKTQAQNIRMSKGKRILTVTFFLYGTFFWWFVPQIPNAFGPLTPHFDKRAALFSNNFAAVICGPILIFIAAYGASVAIVLSRSIFQRNAS